MTELMRRRRALMGMQEKGPSARLPSEYQEVTWIGTNSGQEKGNVQIDTGFVPKNQNMRLVTDIYLQGTGSWGIFGMLSNSAPYWELYTAGGNCYYKCGSNSETAGAGSVSIGPWYHVDAGKKLYWDNTLKTTKTATDFSGNTYSLKLFATAGTGKACPYFKEIYIYDGDNMILDLVPCYRKSDNRIGFYDIVGNAFLYNSVGAVSTMKKGADV